MGRNILHENSYGFCGGIGMENKIFAYMRISTNHQKTDRQKQTIIEYSISNGFVIDEFISDTITGGTKADNRPNYHNMKNQFRNGDTLVVSDVDRLGRNADDVIVEIKDLQSRGIRVVALDVPFLNDWEKMNDDSLSKMIIDIFVTLKAHIAQQEKEKIHARVMQGLDVARKARSWADRLREYQRNLLRNITNFSLENMEVFQLCSLQSCKA